ncbi:MAG TPA: class I SAM-dependent methyltransferase [Solirubrobacteraceae bacterium]|nr:class I SAM-dependent methyltransferase [Solirubrobacteraceae bacterium]
MTWQHGKPVKEYYDARAPEYDEWYTGAGLFAARERPGWHEAVRALEQAVASLPAGRTLDVACGTGFLTRHLRGEVTGLDQSERMVQIAAERVPQGRFVQGDALELPFEDGSFDRVFTGHFYGHLEDGAREAFLAEARRLAPELVVVDSAVRPDHEREEWQTRVLNDGSRHQVYKRYFDADELSAELGGGVVLHANDWFVMVSTGDANSTSR